MPVVQKPILHGRDHCPGGADPIPCLSTGAGSFATTVVAISDLLAYWRLGETVGPWADTSGIGTPADLSEHGSGTALSPHVSGALASDDDGALELNYDGVALSGGRYLSGIGKDFDMTASGTGEVTVAAWVKVKASAATRRGLIVGTSKWSIPGSYRLGYGLQVIYPSRAIRFSYGQPAGGAEVYAETSGGVVAGDWNLVVGSYDGTTLRLYVNGVLVDETAGSFEPAADDAIWLGMSAGGPATSTDEMFLYGTVDEAAVWTRALTQAEIDALYVSGVGGMAAGSRVLTSDGGGGFSWEQVGTAALADEAVSSAKIADGTIVDADVDSAAEIAPTKLAHPGGTSSFLRADGSWAAPTAGAVATDTIFDAKGDLPAGTGADTAARLPAGSNGQLLSADSSTTTGLKWIAAPSGADPALDAQVWMPLTTVSGGTPELVWDAGDSLIPTLTPI